MKKFATLFSAFMLMVGFAFAGSPEATTYDVQKIESEFSKLDKVEQYVETNDLTIDQLKASHSEVISGISLNENTASFFASKELPANIPAFWWGCVLGIIGIVLVYVLTDKDQDQTKKALYGCLAWGGVVALIYLLSAGTLFAASRGVI